MVRPLRERSPLFELIQDDPNDDVLVEEDTDRCNQP